MKSSEGEKSGGRILLEKMLEIEKSQPSKWAFVPNKTMRTMRFLMVISIVLLVASTLDTSDEWFSRYWLFAGGFFYLAIIALYLPLVLEEGRYLDSREFEKDLFHDVESWRWLEEEKLSAIEEALAILESVKEKYRKNVFLYHAERVGLAPGFILLIIVLFTKGDFWPRFLPLVSAVLLLMSVISMPTSEKIVIVDKQMSRLYSAKKAIKS